jgi:hypothetical protein
MPIASPRYPFNREIIEGAPNDPGVYVLFQGDELIYVGYATWSRSNIRLRLLEHFSGALVPSCATHYGWEICRDPLSRAAELLHEFQKAFDRRPAFNGGDTGHWDIPS